MHETDSEELAFLELDFHCFKVDQLGLKVNLVDSLNNVLPVDARPEFHIMSLEGGFLIFIWLPERRGVLHHIRLPMHEFQAFSHDKVQEVRNSGLYAFGVVLDIDGVGELPFDFKAKVFVGVVDV